MQLENRGCCGKISANDSMYDVKQKLHNNLFLPFYWTMIEDSEYLTTPLPSTPIWRYMDFITFYRILTTGTILFRRLDKFPDELEGTLSPNTQQERLKYRSDFDYTTSKEAKTWTKRDIENIESFKAGTLANSWIISTSENYAMCKIYLRGNREGVAVKSTVGRLTESLTENEFKIFLGKVSYESLEQKDINIYSVSTNKSKPYEFENELRALIFHQFTYSSDRMKAKIPISEIGAEVPLRVKDLIEEIYISPFAGTWFNQLIRSFIKDKFPTFDEKHIKNSQIKEKSVTSESGIVKTKGN